MSNSLNSFLHRGKEPEPGVLYVVGTPIGNLNDVSKRSLNILKNTSLILSEDTRKTKILLGSFGIKNKLISFNDHNSIARLPHIISKLKNGASIALVSDAGTPLISDPGELLVKKVREANFDIISVPGPCAAIAAIVSSGLECSNFIFYGFIPRSSKERKKILNSIKNNDISSIVYESPKRIIKLLIDLKDLCGDERRISISRELTKKYEEHIGNNINQALRHFEDNTPKGEFTIVIGGKEKNFEEENNLKTIKYDLLDLINLGLNHSTAANYLSKKYKKPKNQVYKLLFDDNLG
tara:strand:- start:2853 stop:3737 length:885 start_codon:yes stop_codon:yes gene_type:complete